MRLYFRGLVDSGVLLLERVLKQLITFEDAMVCVNHVADIHELFIMDIKNLCSLKMVNKKMDMDL